MTSSIDYTIATLPTPIGALQAICSEAAVVSLGFPDRDNTPRQCANLRRTNPKARITEGENAVSRALKAQLAAYFVGERKVFDLPLDARGTPFQQQVWAVLRDIPYGKTWSYRDQAERIGRPKAVRAVASANARNPIALVIPCHRVIARNGQLAGYGGGVSRKAFLIELERRYA